MSRFGRAVGALAVLSLGGGTALAVAPSVAVRAPLTRLVAVVGNGYFLVAGIGVLSLLWACAVATAWVMDGPSQVRMPDRETFVPVSTPGGEFDEAVAQLAGQHERAARPVEHREAVRARLRADAIETLEIHHGHDHPAAVAAVESGEWTEDRFAAAFVGSDDAPGPRWYQRLWRWLRRDDPFAVGANRTAAELVSLAERER